MATHTRAYCSASDASWVVSGQSLPFFVQNFTQSHTDLTIVCMGVGELSPGLALLPPPSMRLIALPQTSPMHWWQLHKRLEFFLWLLYTDLVCRHIDGGLHIFVVTLDKIRHVLAILGSVNRIIPRFMIAAFTCNFRKDLVRLCCTKVLSLRRV